jgi:hypothetical protein
MKKIITIGGLTALLSSSVQAQTSAEILVDTSIDTYKMAIIRAIDLNQEIKASYDLHREALRDKELVALMKKQDAVIDSYQGLLSVTGADEVSYQSLMVELFPGDDTNSFQSDLLDEALAGHKSQSEYGSKEQTPGLSTKDLIATLEKTIEESYIDCETHARNQSLFSDSNSMISHYRNLLKVSGMHSLAEDISLYERQFNLSQAGALTALDSYHENCDGDILEEVKPIIAPVLAPARQSNISVILPVPILEQPFLEVKSIEPSIIESSTILRDTTAELCGYVTQEFIPKTAFTSSDTSLLRDCKFANIYSDLVVTRMVISYDEGCKSSYEENSLCPQELKGLILSYCPNGGLITIDLEGKILGTSPEIKTICPGRSTQ